MYEVVLSQSARRSNSEVVEERDLTSGRVSVEKEEGFADLNFAANEPAVVFLEIGYSVEAVELDLRDPLGTGLGLENWLIIRSHLEIELESGLA